MESMRDFIKEAESKSVFFCKICNDNTTQVSVQIILT